MLSRLTASASTENLLEVQILRSYPGTIELEDTLGWAHQSEF